jgi:N-acetylglucosamine malate deacetylase 1
MSKRILIISPHPDDESLGLGGTIAKYISEGNDVFVLTISGHLPPLYSREDYDKTVKESYEAFKILGIKNSLFLEIPATMIGDEPIHELNKKIIDVMQDYKPDIVFCPFPDRHIDHKLVFECSMVATRPVNIGKELELVAAYETLSETHWNAPYIEPNFTPNMVVNIDNFIDTKINALRCYESQINEDSGPRSIKAIRALAEFRGTQSGFNFGEALYIIRMIG